MSEEQNDSFIKSLHEFPKMFYFISDKGWLNHKTELIQNNLDDDFMTHKISHDGYHLFSLFTTTYQKQLPVKTLQITERRSENKSFSLFIKIAYCEEDNTLYYRGNVKTEVITTPETTIDLTEMNKSEWKIPGEKYHG